MKTKVFNLIWPQLTFVGPGHLCKPKVVSRYHLLGSTCLHSYNWQNLQSSQIIGWGHLRTFVLWGHRGHQPLFANNFCLRRDRDVGVVSLCFSKQDASRHMQYMPNLGHHMTLTWGQILTMTFQGHNAYVSIRLDETNPMAPKSSLHHWKQRRYKRKTVLLKCGHFQLLWPL